MQLYNQPNELSVFGHQVQTFPSGIKEAFGDLMKMTDRYSRSYYGLSQMNADNKILYWATAEEKFAGEAEKFNYERYFIAKGNYLAVTVHNWLIQTDCIKDVFHDMMQDERADTTKQCIEWYKSDDEMICLLQIKNECEMEKYEILKEIDKVSMELHQMILPLSEEQMNTIPFKDSWTAAQLATHVRKSNKAMAQAMEMKGKSAERNPVFRVKELKDTFLNYSVKFKSPAFIVPADERYEKKVVIGSLKKSNEYLKTNAVKADPNEMIDLPAAFGEITKLELLHFVVYHTQRHIHQLKNILQYI
jgi:DinB superfamily